MQQQGRDTLAQQGRDIFSSPTTFSTALKMAFGKRVRMLDNELCEQLERLLSE